MGITPFPGKDIGLFTVLHVLIVGDEATLVAQRNGTHKVALIPIDKEDAPYFTGGKVIDLGAITP